MRPVPRVRALLARRDAVAQVAVVVGAFAAYEVARHAMQPNWAQAFANARRIESVEQVLGVAWEQSLQRAFLAIPDLIQALNIFYFVGHFLFTAIFFVWLYRRSRDGFIAATLFSVVIHWQFPTAPPRLLEDLGFVDTLRLMSGIDIGSQQTSALSNPVAAVPSLHAGYALGVGAGLLKFGRSHWTRIGGVAYPLSVLLTIIVTGNHFVLDAVAGLAVMVAGFLAASVAYRHRRAVGSHARAHLTQP